MAMTEGVAYLSSFISLSRSIGIWNGECKYKNVLQGEFLSDPGTRGCSMLDGGAPFYET